MRRYIFDKRNGVHIIDLAKTLVMLRAALDFLYETVVAGKSVLFVGTKKQAQKVLRDTATECGQPYVATRWLGGTLTNNDTIRRSVSRMRDLVKLEETNALADMHKKEAASLRRELEKLRRNLFGISNMSQLPGAIFVVDINREAIPVAEANRLGIPVVAMVDTNCDPDPIDYPVPANDDAIRAINLVCGLVGETVGRANAEHAKVAAEIARKKEKEEKAAAEKAAAAAAEEPAEEAKAEPETAADDSADKTGAKEGGDELPADPK